MGAHLNPAQFGSLIVLVLGCIHGHVAGQWVTYTNETNARIDPLLDPQVFANDVEEKDYAWGDLDKDGDDDVIVVRKNPFSDSIGFVNLLLMNEGGVLVDRADIFATASSDGTMGFKDLTADRDVILVDVNGDTWLDVIVAPAGNYEPNLPKTFSHPRVYINLQGDPWQGLRYEESRIPLITPTPNFCAVAAGDVTGDGMPDLYFSDYHNDLENRLLINDGTGIYTDETVARTTPALNDGVFGTHSVIADINDDGRGDIVTDHALGPYSVRIAWNPIGNEGFFSDVETVYTGSSYFFEVGDLNSDGLLDIVVVDDGTDVYLLNQGGGNLFQCGSCAFQNSGGFGGNALIRDLNNDGWEDVMVADVDIDVPGCGGVMDIHRNNADPPNVTFTYDTANIPTNMLIGTHDVAAVDINGDDWLDLIIGRCSGTEIWINQPPISLTFAYPDGLPTVATPDQSTSFRVAVSAGSGTTPVPGTGRQYVSIDGGAFVESVMTEESPDVYLVDLPSVPCTSVIEFYFSAETTGGSTVFEPSEAPTSSYKALSTISTLVALDERFEVDAPDWTVVNGAGLLDGPWVRVDPNMTLFGTDLAQPDVDFGVGPGETMCYITEQDFNADPADDDVDGGPTILVSPVVDLDGTDAIVSYARWHFCNDHLQGNTDEQDALVTEVSNGGPWVAVEETFWTNGGWEQRSFKVGDYVTPTSAVQVRFVTSDNPNDSLTESGIDSVLFTRFVCEDTCGGDAICTDALFCNGVELCVDNQCVPGTDPCAPGGQLCDEASDQCLDCFFDQDCDDHLFCNGAEVCAGGGVCLAGEDPCQPGQICDEVNDLCLLCSEAMDCDMCGGEACVNGTCLMSGAAVANGTFEDQTGWQSNIPDDGTITYVGNLTVLGPDNENAAFVWASQGPVDFQGGPLEFDLVSYSTKADKFDFDRPVFYIDGEFYGLEDHGVLGAVIPEAGNGPYGNIDNANQVTDVHFYIDIESQFGSGPHTIGFGVMTADGIFGPGIAVFDNVAGGVPVDPCPGQLCSDGLGCVDCIAQLDCDDGQFCNGVETCDGAGACQSGIPPCGAGERCDEEADTCASGPPVLQAKMGDPLPDLTPAELARFTTGKLEFERLFTEEEGLGPGFNKDSCAGCHNMPVGGSGTILVTRFGFTDKGSFDPLEELGGSLLQEQSITPECEEQIHGNTVAQRLTNSILGAGLVEAIPDADLLVNVPLSPGAISGRAHMVTALEDPKGPMRVGRFGWKAQLPTVLSFSGDAANNELGITNRLLVDEQDPNGSDPPSLGPPDDCDTVPDPEDDGPVGSAFIDQVTDFQRFLAPPPQTPRSGMSGEALFDAIGCTDCHIASFTTGTAPEAALSNKEIKPYSDFLLHHMGLLGDQIGQGDAEPLEIRTPSLWGLRVRDPMLHDGRVIGGTFSERIRGADGLGGVVGWHNVIGNEAALSAAAFQNLTVLQQDAIIAFLDSLGRREFDLNSIGDQIGDGSVDLVDYNIFRQDCYEQGPFLPDHTCAIADVDQDTDVDLDDFDLFLQAYDLPLADCNDNKQPDLLDILVGTSVDDDFDGIPDNCAGGGPCQNFDSCADADGDNVRDDNCVWWACEQMVCTPTDIVFADMGGQFGNCQPDGTADGNDRFHALNCFANTDPNNPFPATYPCENNAPTAFNVDAGGQFGGCSPDGVCDGNDAFAALNAFDGSTTCSCPLDGGPQPEGGSGNVVVDSTIVALQAPATARAGQLLEIDVVLVDGVSDLRGYQLHVGVTGGRGGDLVLQDIAIHERRGAAYAGHGSWDAFNVTTAQMIAGLDTSGVAIPAGAYLATFTYRVSDDAVGTFVIDVLHDITDARQRSFLFPTPSHGRIVIRDTVPAEIRIVQAAPQDKRSARRR